MNKIPERPLVPPLADVRKDWRLATTRLAITAKPCRIID